MSVVDSANASGVVVDAIRCAKIAMDKGIYGYLLGPSAYYMKSPIKQIIDEIAINEINNLIGDENK